MRLGKDRAEMKAKGTNNKQRIENIPESLRGAERTSVVSVRVWYRSLSQQRSEAAFSDWLRTDAFTPDEGKQRLPFFHLSAVCLG